MKYGLVFVLISMVSALCFGQTDSAAKKPSTGTDKLPVEISTYIKTSFPNHKVLRFSQDDDKEYEVYLDKDIVLDFNNRNQIKSIDGKSKLPDTAIPPKILAYVKASYSSNSITDWETDGKIQEITLDNGVELSFTNDGEYIPGGKM